MKTFLREYLRDDRGAALVEYAIIIFVVTFGLYAGLLAMGKNISSTGTEAAAPIAAANAQLR